MSKTNLAGLTAAVVIIASVFLPWLSIESRHLVFTGLQTKGSTFGEPGRLNIVFAVIAGILFIAGKKWAQRVNLFFSGFLVAWTFRNMILFARCEMGECPQLKIGIYLSLAAAIVALVCVLIFKPPKAVS